MFKAKIETYLDELEFKCPFCGIDQVYFLDRKAIIYCVDCGTRFDPNPFELINKKLSRICYHFMSGSQEEVGDTQTEIESKSKIYSRGKDTSPRSITSYFHQGDQTFLTG